MLQLGTELQHTYGYWFVYKSYSAAPSITQLIHVLKRNGWLLLSILRLKHWAFPHAWNKVLRSAFSLNLSRHFVLWKKSLRTMEVEIPVKLHSSPPSIMYKYCKLLSNYYKSCQSLQSFLSKIVGSRSYQKLNNLN